MASAGDLPWQRRGGGVFSDAGPGGREGKKNRAGVFRPRGKTPMERSSCRPDWAWHFDLFIVGCHLIRARMSPYPRRTVGVDSGGLIQIIAKMTKINFVIGLLLLISTSAFAQEEIPSVIQSGFAAYQKDGAKAAVAAWLNGITDGIK